MFRTPLKAAVLGAIALGLAMPIAYAQQNPCSPKGANPCATAKKGTPAPSPAKSGAKSDNKNPCAPNPCAATKK